MTREVALLLRHAAAFEVAGEPSHVHASCNATTASADRALGAGGYFADDRVDGAASGDSALRDAGQSRSRDGLRRLRIDFARKVACGA